MNRCVCQSFCGSSPLADFDRFVCTHSSGLLLDTTATPPTDGGHCTKLLTRRASYIPVGIVILPVKQADRRIANPITDSSTYIMKPPSVALYLSKSQSLKHVQVHPFTLSFGCNFGHREFSFRDFRLFIHQSFVHTLLTVLSLRCQEAGAAPVHIHIFTIFQRLFRSIHSRCRNSQLILQRLPHNLSLNSCSSFQSLSLHYSLSRRSLASAIFLSWSLCSSFIKMVDNHSLPTPWRTPP